jgi:protease I
MASKQLSGFKVAVLVTDRTQEPGLQESKNALAKAGATVVMILSATSRSRRSNRDDPISASVQLRLADPADFDALLLPADPRSPKSPKAKNAMVNFISDISGQGKPIAIIYRMPDDISAFNREMINVFAQGKQQSQRAA